MTSVRGIAIGAVVLVAICAVAGVSAALSGASLRIARLPPPTGDYAVGTSALTLANKMPVQVWYPAAAGSSGRRAPYRFAMRGGSLRTRLISAFVGTNASIDLPVAAGRHPVLMYAPAWGGVRSDNTTQAENLASHGFIVVAMDDPYGDRPMDMSSDSAFRQTLRWAAEKTRLQAAASLRVLDAFEQLDSSGTDRRFTGHIDLRRVGMFGFSFGGAVAAEAATLDPRVRAAVNLDGWIFSDAAKRGVPRPFMVFSTDEANDPSMPPIGTPERRFADLLDRSNTAEMVAGFERHGGFLVTIAGTGHFNFCDTALMPSLRHRGVGTIDKERAASIVSDYLVRFFDRFLNGGESASLQSTLADGPSHHLGPVIDPAARLEIWDVPRPAKDARNPVTEPQRLSRSKCNSTVPQIS